MKFKYFIYLILFFILCSCQKYLEKKPDKKLVTPSSIQDLQALLDFNTVMNRNSPSLGETSGDNYFLTNSDISSLYPSELNAYKWDTDVYEGYPNDWSNTYDPIYYTNVVLENINNFERNAQNESVWNNVKGSAFLYRGIYFLQAAWTWTKAYDESSATNDLGIPLRSTSDFNKPSVRSTVQETYNQIISDLNNSVLFLPNSPTHLMRPSKVAAYAYLARTYLSMRKYDSCYKYADLCLQLKNQLMDYNIPSSFIQPTSIYPIKRFNPEVIMHTTMYGYYNLYIGRIDSNLYKSYSTDDLRKAYFFKPNGSTFEFRGNYDGSDNGYLFNGVATDEVYLMRAECYARLGNTAAALNDVNTLLQSRWKSGTFVPLSAASSQAALDLVLTERRKELIYRGLRWMDIKRLNKENVNISITHIIDNQPITLPPNDNRFALPLPKDVIDISGMQQNPR